MNRDISKLRQNYLQASLNKEELEIHPIDQFNKWFQDALREKINEPNAFILSTVSESGQPSGRTVLLKEITEEGFIFYTNYNSEKAKNINSNPKVAATFLWLGIERQVRVEGLAVKVSKEISQKYFDSRPRGSKIGAWSSPQSSIIENRDILTQSYEHYDSEFSDDDQIPVPPFWGGFIIRPTAIEFWQGRPSRLHDRFRFELIDNSWQISRLAP